jgi:hypothetical protein
MSGRSGTQTQRHDPGSETLVVAQKVDAALGAVLWRAVPAMRNLEHCYTANVPRHLGGSPRIPPSSAAVSWPRPGAIPPAAHPVALAAAKPVAPKGREKALRRIVQAPGSR